jgi:hypothetical protein
VNPSVPLVDIPILILQPVTWLISASLISVILLVAVLKMLFLFHPIPFVLVMSAIPPLESLKLRTSAPGLPNVPLLPHPWTVMISMPAQMILASYPILLIPPQHSVCGLHSFFPKIVMTQMLALMILVILLWDVFILLLILNFAMIMMLAQMMLVIPQQSMLSHVVSTLLLFAMKPMFATM